MSYTAREVIQYAEEEGVKFIRLAFCDVFGRQKNLSIMPCELERAFSQGIPFNAGAVFGTENELILHPDPATLSVLPWRPENGRVVRMYCKVTRPDGSPFEGDTRSLLANAADLAASKGLGFSFGSRLSFYLFRLSEYGEPTLIPCDNAGFMDIAPIDRGENIRRQICLTLEKMGICPESSHHEEGPGQNEIDFRPSSALHAADDAMTFMTAVRTAAFSSGLWAELSPKPLEDQPGSSFKISLSLSSPSRDSLMHCAAGIMTHLPAMTLFLDPTEQSYDRLRDISSAQLIRLPDETSGRWTELCTPDPSANPYLAFTLLILASLDGIERQLALPSVEQLRASLPGDLAQARRAALESGFIARSLPRRITEIWCR